MKTGYIAAPTGGAFYHLLAWRSALAHLLFSSFFLTAFAGEVLSAAPADNEGVTASLEMAATTMSQYFKAMKSLEFKAVQETTVSSTGQHYTEELSYVGEANCYRFDVTDPNPRLSVAGAFNGEYGQYLTKDDGLLALKKGERFSDMDAMTVLGALNPFAWFTADQYGGIHSATPKCQIPTPVLLGNAEEWKRRLTTNTVPRMQMRGKKQLLAITMDGGTVPFETVKCTYTVLFDPDRGFFPVAWERFDKEDDEREVYEIDEFASAKAPKGGVFIYPSKATLSIYNAADGPPYCKKTISITSIKVGVDFDKDAFTIDPATANVIQDMDSKKYIRVPK